MSCLVPQGLRAADGVETMGDVLRLVLPVTATALTVGRKDGRGTLQFGEAMGLTLGLTGGLKVAVHEGRPNGGQHSFPSGHTSISFVSAEFLRKRYGWKYGVPAYAVASFVGYSRVEAKQHYVHDVLAAAIIGAGSGYLFTRSWKGFHVEAGIGEGVYALAVNRPW